jgi:hypothetical protein
MLYNLEDDLVKHVWHKDFFDACKSRLSKKEYQDMVDELNNIIQEKLDSKEDVLVASFIPGSDWSDTVWEPIYSQACGYDEEYSAQFFGLLVAQVLIDREEKWYFLRQDIAKSMVYFIPKNKKQEKKVKQEKKEVKIDVTIDDLKKKFEG